ncbi:TPA: AbiEi antitoxin N-terminal domain-containing protein [Providencia stuartii]|nr:AbiEi antitoxin N-terminal domain-containing protein [Providencia stuartii]
MSSKINWLITLTSPGSLVLQQWLTKNGVSYSLAQKDTQSGWLKRLYSGVYYRPSAKDDVKSGGGYRRVTSSEGLSRKEDPHTTSTYLTDYSLD